jgi:hypothetical protein
LDRFSGKFSTIVIAFDVLIKSFLLLLPFFPSGGQLKSKNGQKYVVNQYRTAEGFYVSRPCAFVYLILFLVMMLLSALVTYLIFVPR